MSQNLKHYVMEEAPMTPGQLLENLARQVPGRSVGDRYVVSARIDENNDLEFELDDGSKYAFTCRAVN